MLRLLRVQNLAVIESVEVEFGPGFTVLTGETGAGKSILIEALGLLLGARASVDLVRSGAASATIEARFKDPETGREHVVRREISAQGRSRAFLDGGLATAAGLRTFAERMVELHGQHEHHALLDPVQHLAMLDVQVGVSADVDLVQAAWHRWRAARDRAERSRMDGRERAARLDLIAFQLAEIDRVAPVAGEDDELTVTRRVLANAERLKTLCDECYTALYDGDGAVLAALGQVWKRVAELAGVDPQFSEHLSARDDIKARLEDLALTTRRYGDALGAAPERLQEVEERLVALERLKRKFGPGLPDVLACASRLREEQALLGDSAGTADTLAQDEAQARAEYDALAEAVSRRRRAGADPLSRDMERRLSGLGMPSARFEVRFQELVDTEARRGERGIDEVEFFISTNAGEDLRPLSRTISGGELSRVMLALKARVAGHHGVPTVVFDEVDAGIGGRVADVVGTRLRELGSSAQVLCITHLPQIAAKATTHFRIEKVVRRGRTATTVTPLDENGRADEIARMMGGDVDSPAVRQAALDLLLAPGAKGKHMAKVERERRRRG